jgi:hypothetical protein
MGMGMEVFMESIHSITLILDKTRVFDL